MMVYCFENVWVKIEDQTGFLPLKHLCNIMLFHFFYCIVLSLLTISMLTSNDKNILLSHESTCFSQTIVSDACCLVNQH